MSNSFPLSERYRLAGEEWAELEAAAAILEDTKSAVLAQRMAQLGDIAVNKAEMAIKASPQWIDHVKTIVEARKAANLAKIKLDVARMEYGEQQSIEANKRAEMRL